MRQFIQELTAFFASSPVREAFDIAAQSYEPGSSTGYHPATDKRLANLVAAAQTVGKSEWARVKRAIDTLLDAPGGHAHLQVLRLACSDPSAGWPAIAQQTKTAMKYGRRTAEEQERMRMLEATYAVAVSQGCSPISVAMRVLAEEQRIWMAGVKVGSWAVALEAERGIAHRKVDLDAVTEETDALVSAASKAYAAASRAAGDSVRARKERAERDNEAWWAEYEAKKKAKESGRFHAKMRRAS